MDWDDLDYHTGIIGALHDLGLTGIVMAPWEQAMVQGIEKHDEPFVIDWAQGDCPGYGEYYRFGWMSLDKPTT